MSHLSPRQRDVLRSIYQRYHVTPTLRELTRLLQKGMLSRAGPDPHNKTRVWILTEAGLNALGIVTDAEKAWEEWLDDNQWRLKGSLDLVKETFFAGWHARR